MKRAHRLVEAIKKAAFIVAAPVLCACFLLGWLCAKRDTRAKIKDHVDRVVEAHQAERKRRRK